MQLQTEIEPLEARRDKCTLKFWERSRRVDARFWSGYRAASQRLSSQTTPLAHAEALRNKYQIPESPPAPLQSYSRIFPALPKVSLRLLSVTTNKAATNVLELRMSALETLHSKYPRDEWLHVYTDGSYIAESDASGAGAYCEFFKLHSAVGKGMSNYDGEISAIAQAARKIQTLGLKPQGLVFLVDSQAAILALSNNKTTDCPRTINCRSIMADLISEGWKVRIQWIPSHVGIPGNEHADVLAKKGAGLEQPEPPQALRTARQRIEAIINNHISSRLQNQAVGKSWCDLINPGHIPSDLERPEAVARFRLITGHDYLQAHLFRIGIAGTDICPLCSRGTMVAEHLLTCPELESLPSDAVKRYWEARSRMAQLPQTGVG